MLILGNQTQMQGKKQHKIMQTGHYLLHKRYIIGAFYSLKPFEWLGPVLLLLSTEGVPQMSYYITWRYRADLLWKHGVNLQDNPLEKVCFNKVAM